MNEFETNILEKESDGNAKHHEDNITFQTEFVNDVEKLYQAFPNNPFEMQNLTIVADINAEFDNHIYYNLSKLLPTDSSQVLEFIRDRLLYSKVSIKSKISLNHFILPGNETGKKPKFPDKRLSTSFLTKQRAAITHRRSHAKQHFETEIFNTSQCLSTDSNTLYHGTKSDILRRFDVISLPVPESVESVLIVELSPILRHDFKPDTFLHFARMVYDYIIKVGQDYDRIDVICDRYFEKSLKTQTRDFKKGSGNILAFDDDATFS